MLSLLMQGQFSVFLLLLLALILSLSFHEFGHAIVAKWFGDTTAERAGRLTLNPIKHIDPIGLAMVAFLGIGYAKPVPTDPRNYSRATADLWVALAGPGMNLLLALTTWNVYAWFWQSGWQNEGALIFFTLFAQINLLLMLFNLIPLGPLDGHYIFPHLLPKAWAGPYRRLNARYGTGIFLGLVVLSLAGLPLLSGLAEFSRVMLNWITLV
jgi:Zn-dependent protease